MCHMPIVEHTNWVNQSYLTQITKSNTRANAFSKHTMIRADELSVGHLVGVRVGNLLKHVPVEGVEHYQETVNSKPVVVLGRKYVEKVPLRMSSYKAWVQAGRPYVDKVRQSRTVQQNSYNLHKTSYKLAGERQWRTIPSLTPVIALSRD